MKKLPLKTALMGACAAAMGWLAGCAVGPNFKPPEAPRNAGFAPAGQPRPDGQAQRFVDGMDIPGQWWTLFQSAPLNAFIEPATRARKQPPAERGAGGAAAAEQNRRRAGGQLLPERIRSAGKPTPKGIRG